MFQLIGVLQARLYTLYSAPGHGIEHVLRPRYVVLLGQLLDPLNAVAVGKLLNVDRFALLLCDLSQLRLHQLCRVSTGDDTKRTHYELQRASFAVARHLIVRQYQRTGSFIAEARGYFVTQLNRRVDSGIYTYSVAGFNHIGYCAGVRVLPDLAFVRQYALSQGAGRRRRGFDGQYHRIPAMQHCTRQYHSAVVQVFHLLFSVLLRFPHGIQFLSCTYRLIHIDAGLVHGTGRQLLRG